MTYLEPVRTPDRYLEPPEPVEEFCEVCDRDETYCECGNCDACGDLGPTTETVSGDEVLWMCSTCREAA